MENSPGLYEENQAKINFDNETFEKHCIHYAIDYAKCVRSYVIQINVLCQSGAATACYLPDDLWQKSNQLLCYSVSICGHGGRLHTCHASFCSQTISQCNFFFKKL